MNTDASDVYAVIRTGGKQYRVSPGQRLRVERLDGAAGDRVSFDQVLLVSSGGEVAVGAPTLEAARVSGEIIEQGRGRKIRVFKYKNKTRYRRLRGHRQLHTAVRVDEVTLGDRAWTAPVATTVDDADTADETAVDELAPVEATAEPAEDEAATAQVDGADETVEAEATDMAGAVDDSDAAVDSADDIDGHGDGDQNGDSDPDDRSAAREE